MYKPKGSQTAVKPEKVQNTFINKGLDKGSSSSAINWQGTGERLTDKILRPVVSGVIGAGYYGYLYGFEFDYLLMKFGIVAGCSVVADYVGNLVVDSSVLKSVGLRRVENYVVEPVFAGVSLALLNRYVLGVENKFMNDLMIGAGTDLVAGFALAPLMRMTF